MQRQLVSETIDHLHADKPSLFACSLTAKQWLPSTRYHIFSQVHLRPTNIKSFVLLQFIHITMFGMSRICSTPDRTSNMSVLRHNLDKSGRKEGRNLEECSAQEYYCVEYLHGVFIECLRISVEAIHKGAPDDLHRMVEGRISVCWRGKRPLK